MPVVGQRLQGIAVAGLVVFYLAAGAGRAWGPVQRSGNARDFATYYYAAQAAMDGDDPYDTVGLSRRARAEGTRRVVHPYFYPPPFLLGMVWVRPMSLAAAYKAWFFLNQAFLLGTLAVLWRWFRPALWVLALVLATLTPVPDNIKMGQANLPVMLLAVAGLAGRRGGLVGAGAMAKMSPALYLVGWAARGWWRPCLVACATAVGLSLVTLPLVGFDDQLRFYTEIMPSFSTGAYHGLRVPITLPANHSIPDLFNQAFPGPDNHHLSAVARHGSKLVSLAVLGALAWVARRPGAGDHLGHACVAGAITVLMVITPVYTYEHHFAMLILPAVAVFAALDTGRLGRRWWVPVGLGYFFVAWPLFWLRPLQKVLPAAHWVLQESKFVGAVVLMIALAIAAGRAPGGAASGPGTD